MDDFEHNLTALKEEFAPIHAAYGHDQVDPGRFGEDCENAVKAQPGASARFAAFSVFQHAKVAPERPLTVIDPAPRPWFSRWFKPKPKRVVFSNALALAKFFELALSQSASLGRMTGIFVYHCFFPAHIGGAHPLMGQAAAWRVHQHGMEALKAMK